MPANYKDGKGEPIDNMPEPREISNAVGAFKGRFPNSKAGVTALFTFWGQFMDHDITVLPEQDSHGEHLNIKIPKGDPHMDPTGKGNVEMEFARSLVRSNNPRKFLDDVTSYIDASNVYGSDKEQMNGLRTFRDGKMKVSEGNFLPFDPENPSFFIAGDFRANENIALTSVHTLFVREHNRKAAEFKTVDPNLSDEELFQLARQWNIALLQKITVEDWLPNLIGPEAYYKYIGAYKGYNEDIDSSVMNEFATAGFRVGHLLLRSDHPMVKKGGKVDEVLDLKDMFLKPEKMKDDRLDMVFRGLSGVNAK